MNDTTFCTGTDCPLKQRCLKAYSMMTWEITAIGGWSLHIATVPATTI